MFRNVFINECTKSCFQLLKFFDSIYWTNLGVKLFRIGLFSKRKHYSVLFHKRKFSFEGGKCEFNGRELSLAWAEGKYSNWLRGKWKWETVAHLPVEPKPQVVNQKALQICHAIVNILKVRFLITRIRKGLSVWTATGLVLFLKMGPCQRDSDPCPNWITIEFIPYSSQSTWPFYNQTR